MCGAAHTLRLLCVQVLLLCSVATALTGCADGYNCYDGGAGIVWVLKDDGNVNGPTCAKVCQNALCGTGTFHNCARDFDTAPTNIDEINAIVEPGFGFSCKKGGCWSGVSGEGQIWISRDEADVHNCYIPEEPTVSCSVHPGNANCFGERYALLCPCEAVALDEACHWDSPPNRPPVATWPKNGEEATTCIDRVNYWRKRACDEGWPECPPCGLPPMTECIACHECANSEAAYDRDNGAHASYKRCGESSQGEGGGTNCAAVIDAFVSERNADGVCDGHCGPIVADGCQTFFWGRDDDNNYYTLNWRSCNVDTCEGYCENPSSNECFRVDESPVPFGEETDPPAPTEAPVTEPPVKPTNKPTDPPVKPTDPPVEPTDPPVKPTDPPVKPTDPPVKPTDAPVKPTDDPVSPTDNHATDDLHSTDGVAKTEDENQTQAGQQTQA